MQSKEIIKHIVKWLKNYADDANMKGFVVGVSGGIDSAVVSTLACMTGLKCLCLEMPIRQKPDQVNRALEHFTDLKQKFTNIECLSLSLDSTFEAFFNQVDKENSNQVQLALANSRARMRMLTLYYYGQIQGLLVTGTGNKVEDFGVGFFTKYGDGGVDISPIADLTKSQIYAIAKELGIIESIQKAQPTDGLWDTDRTDEQQMGATYPELEWAMAHYATHKADDFEGREKEVFLIYSRLHRVMQHKINPIPVCKIPKNYVI